jgi:hypothetical protein
MAVCRRPGVNLSATIGSFVGDEGYVSRRRIKQSSVTNAQVLAEGWKTFRKFPQMD